MRLARTFTDDVEFSTEDATRTDPDFLVKIVSVAVQAGATTINIPDTVGYTTPEEYAAIFRMVIAKVPGLVGADGKDNVIFSTHCHDDLGMAVANTLAGIQAGARQVECTINGIGERAGNAALEEIAAALMVRRDKLPYTNNIKMEKLYPTSQMLAECISFGGAPNKAIVGANAFAHDSGIHQHGVMANPLTYEIMTPESVGVPANNLVLGKHSGRRALEQRLVELGHTLTREQLDEVYHRFTELADRKKIHLRPGPARPAANPNKVCSHDSLLIALLKSVMLVLCTYEHAHLWHVTGSIAEPEGSLSESLARDIPLFAIIHRWPGFKLSVSQYDPISIYRV